VMRGGEPGERRLTVRTYNAEFVRPAYGPDDVRRVRSLLRMSQVVFARFLGTQNSPRPGFTPPRSLLFTEKAAHLASRLDPGLLCHREKAA